MTKLYAWIVDLLMTWVDEKDLQEVIDELPDPKIRGHIWAEIYARRAATNGKRTI